jgi:hypothetical protein
VRANSLPIIKFYPDWGHPWPLWGSVAEDNLILTPTHLGLSPQTTFCLRHWYDFWQGHVDADSLDETTRGWDAAVNREIWMLAGYELARRLQHELGSSYIIESRFDGSDLIR